MSDPLALKYRPQRFTDIIGQKITPAVLQQMVTTNSVPSGLLFAGPSGCGKTTAARILAAALTDTDYAYTEIDAASNGGVDAVRALTDSLRYGTGEPRVIVYDEAQSMTREAFNALLKTLEEPPPGVHFVLVTTEPEKIPETVKTRLMEFEFHRVPVSVILDRLVAVARTEVITIDTDLLKVLADRSGGNMRTALTLLDQVSRAGITDVDRFQQLMGEQDFAPALLSAIAAGDLERALGELDSQLARTGNPSVVVSHLVHCLTDLLVIRSGGTVAVTGPALDARVELASRLGPDRVVAAMKLLWDLRTRVRASDDPVSNLELVVVLMTTNVFARKAPVAAPAPKPMVTHPVTEAKPLTAEELRARLTGRS